MKRTLILLAASITAAVALVAAQDAPSKPDKSSDVTLTGCLIQGSGATVFLLDNARLNPQDKDEKGKTYKVSGSVSNADLSKHVNHEVALSGNPESKVVPTPPAGQMTQEKDLPKLEAKTLTMVAETCSPASR